LKNIIALCKINIHTSGPRESPLETGLKQNKRTAAPFN